jgi:hypothetical protein
VHGWRLSPTQSLNGVLPSKKFLNSDRIPYFWDRSILSGLKELSDLYKCSPTEAVDLLRAQISARLEVSPESSIANPHYITRNDIDGAVKALDDRLFERAKRIWEVDSPVEVIPPSIRPIVEERPEGWPYGVVLDGLIDISTVIPDRDQAAHEITKARKARMVEPRTVPRSDSLWAVSEIDLDIVHRKFHDIAEIRGDWLAAANSHHVQGEDEMEVDKSKYRISSYYIRGKPAKDADT